jgi:hypothetical protein
VSEGRTSGLFEFGISGTDSGGIRGSYDGGAALGTAGVVDPGRVSVGLGFLGVDEGIAESGSAGAGLGVAGETGFFGVSVPFPVGVERGSISFGSTSGGNPPGLFAAGNIGVIGNKSGTTIGTSDFLGWVVGVVAVSLPPAGRIASTFGGSGVGFVLAAFVSGVRAGEGGDVADSMPPGLPGMIVAGEAGYGTAILGIDSIRGDGIANPGAGWKTGG